MNWLLTLLIFLPLLGALLCFLLPAEETGLHRGVGLGTSLVTFLTSLGLLVGFQPERMNYEVDVSWTHGFGIHYHLGVDGISLWLVILTTFLMSIVFLSIKTSIQKKVREFVACLLILETGMLGAFLSLDMFLFYVFWEVMLIPMYFVIGIWGGTQRMYASIKFVLFTMAGSLLMLAAVLYLYIKGHNATGIWSFSYDSFKALSLTHQEQLFCFLGFALAFCIKVPLFPLHTWLPDAHVEAPTSGSVILAGILLKFGTYGLLRYGMPLFPDALSKVSPFLSALAVIGIIYGSLVAYAQKDIKKLIAYSSVAHMGTVVLGLMMLNGKSVTGAIYQMLAHGISTGGLFLCVGVLYERRHTRQMDDFGGVWQRMPVFGAFFLLFTMASIGLPGLCGFVGEFLILMGTMGAKQAAPAIDHMFVYGPLLCALAATGVILGAVYMLTLFQKVMLGPLKHAENQKLTDITSREKLYLLPLVLAAFGLGLYPNAFLRMITPAVKKQVEEIRSRLTPLAKPLQVTIPVQIEQIPAQPKPQKGAP